MKEPRPEDFDLTRETIDQHIRRANRYPDWLLMLPFLIAYAVFLFFGSPNSGLIAFLVTIGAGLAIPRIKAYRRTRAGADPVAEKIRQYNRALQIYATEPKREDSDGPQGMAASLPTEHRIPASGRRPDLDSFSPPHAEDVWPMAVLMHELRNRVFMTPSEMRFVLRRVKRVARSRRELGIIHHLQEQYARTGKRDPQLYDLYLETKHWRRVRGRALRRAKGACEVCGSNHELQVHHKNYETLGREGLEDLLVVCRVCHKEIHGLRDS